MRKTCSGCGSQAFHVEMREYDAHARTSQSTNMVTEVSKLVCTDCGKEYSV